MKTCKPICLGAFALLFIFTISASSGGAYKCWTNHEGVRECGEKVPPEFAQKGHQELSSQGIVKKEKERAKTEQELAAEAKQAALEAEKQKKIQARTRKDKMLLDTFGSADDIQLTRDDKIAVIESSITLTAKRTEKISEDLQRRRAAAEKQELGGKTPSPEVLQEIESLERQVKNNNQYVADKRQEIEDLKATYAADMARFDKLSSGAIPVGSLE